MKPIPIGGAWSYVATDLCQDLVAYVCVQGIIEHTCSREEYAMRNLFISIVALVAALYMGLVPMYVWFILGVPTTAPTRDGSLVSTAFGLALLCACYVCAYVFGRIAYAHAKH